MSRAKPPEGLMSAVSYRVDSACADMTTAKWKTRDGDHRRAALLLRRAQRELAQAELALLEAARLADLEAARRRS